MSRFNDGDFSPKPTSPDDSQEHWDWPIPGGESLSDRIEEGTTVEGWLSSSGSAESDDSATDSASTDDALEDIVLWYIGYWLFIRDKATTASTLAYHTEASLGLVRKCLDQLVASGDVESKVVRLRSEIRGAKYYNGFQLRADVYDLMLQKYEADTLRAELDSEQVANGPAYADEDDDDAWDPIELVIEHLYWSKRGATVETISRENELSEDVVQDCIDELVDDGQVEATQFTLRSDAHGEVTRDGFSLTSSFREQVERQYEDFEADLAFEAGEEEIDP